jgi:hypothetical protein
MLDANQALSWIVFVRDREKFDRMFPRLKIQKVLYCPWFSYLVSGGVNYRPLVPRSLNPVVFGIDKLLAPFNRLFSLVWYLVIRKV